MTPSMIDIHSHILPATDDGSRSVEESIDMGRLEHEGGTRVIFATPHIYNAGDLHKGPGFVQSVLELQAVFDREEVGITIAQGAEVFPMMDILDALGSNQPITLAGMKRHMLLDLPFGQWPMILEKLTFEMMSVGVTPILAHPERTAPVQESIEVLIPYLERGVLCQVNAGSLLGRYGPVAHQRGMEILTRQWAQFLASDLHRPSSRGATLKAAKDRLADLPAYYVEEITVRNPGYVLEGKSIPSANYQLLSTAPARKGFLGLFQKRK